MKQDDIDIIQKSGHLNYVSPLIIAKEFINYQKAMRQRKLAILNAAKMSSHFDTTKAFFHDVMHRRNNNRLQPWVEQVSQGVSTTTSKHRQSC
jgi:tRNA uridine 5-carbamoylmethylation protein Kti12